MWAKARVQLIWMMEDRQNHTELQTPESDQVKQQALRRT